MQHKQLNQSSDDSMTGGKYSHVTDEKQPGVKLSQSGFITAPVHVHAKLVANNTRPSTMAESGRKCCSVNCKLLNVTDPELLKIWYFHYI